jgi:hypothetical protein
VVVSGLTGAIRLHHQEHAFLEPGIMVNSRSLKIFGVGLLMVCAALMLHRFRSGPEEVSITMGDQIVFKRTKCKPGQNMDGDSCTYPDETKGR